MVISFRVPALVCSALVGCALLAIARPAAAQSAVDGFDPGSNSAGLAVAVQADGKVIIGGAFSMFGGGGLGNTARNGLGRVNPDGSLDTGFAAAVDDFGYVDALAVQSDGKILVAGGFNQLHGVGRRNIGRLEPDGSLDSDFDPGADGAVFAVALQPDGKILIGGEFTNVGGGFGSTPRSHIARLNADGTLDATFDPGTDGSIPGTAVHALAVQPDGRILVGGLFAALGGGTGTTARHSIGRLMADGTVDPTFDPGADDTVLGLALHADGRIVVGGAFLHLGGGGTGLTGRSRIGRLGTDGTVDPLFNPGANLEVRVVMVQPDGKVFVGGMFSGLGGGNGSTIRYGIGRINADGSLDLGFDPGTNGGFVDGALIQQDGKILVVGEFSSLGDSGQSPFGRFGMGRLYPDGRLDSDFNPGATSSINAISIQPDGTMWVGGSFGALGGGTGTSPRQGIGRLNVDGSVASSNPGADGPLLSITRQADGQLLAGGQFTGLGGGGGGTSRSRIGRLGVGGSFVDAFDPGASDAVNALVVQSDGKILVGGMFTMIGGGGTGTFQRPLLARLNADGTIDNGFMSGLSFSGTNVQTVALQPDGKILVGGTFTTITGGPSGPVVRINICRLNADGTVDTTFNPGADNQVWALRVQPDGKILVGGAFHSLGGGTGTTQRERIGRLNTDGSVDMTFNPGANSTVFALALQADQKILVGGAFGMIGGGGTGSTSRSRIARLDGSGAVDPTFNPGANSAVTALALQPDGKVVAAGGFTMLGGGGTGTATRRFIGRLSNASQATQSLNLTTGGTVVTWSRGGAAPEISRATFEASVDGFVYLPLGDGTRTAGGWQLAGQSLAKNQNLFIRARGYFPTGLANGSASVIESVRNVFVSCPTVAPATLRAGTIGTFYFTTFTASGALGTVSFSETGALPAGITFSAGALVGTPTQTGTFPISVSATDANSGCASSTNLSLTIKSVVTFTDEPLVSATTPIKAVHIIELRTFVNELRGQFGLAAFPWTDSTLSGVVAKTMHITELRTALQAAYVAAGLSAPPFTDSTLTPQQTAIRAVHISELRQAVLALQ
jgi:uncharacterized delta-60 repeat protein